MLKTVFRNNNIKTSRQFIVPADMKLCFMCDMKLISNFACMFNSFWTYINADNSACVTTCQTDTLPSWTASIIKNTFALHFQFKRRKSIEQIV